MDVHEGNVRLQLGRSADCLVAGGGSIDDLHVILGLDELAQGPAHHATVIHNECPDGWGWLIQRLALHDEMRRTNIMGMRVGPALTSNRGCDLVHHRDGFQ
jgi:hypothetical protein